jgi:hypothetical protein
MPGISALTEAITLISHSAREEPRLGQEESSRHAFDQPIISCGRYPKSTTDLLIRPETHSTSWSVMCRSAMRQLITA